MAKKTNVPPVRYLDEARFPQWLYYQRDRADSIGGLARFAETDRRNGEPCWPHSATTLAHFVMHLRHEHDGDKSAPAETTLRDAFDEFRRFRDSGGKVPARIGGARPKPNNSNMHRGYVLPRATVEHIKELAEYHGVTQGEVLEQLVSREHARIPAGAAERTAHG